MSLNAFKRVNDFTVELITTDSAPIIYQYKVNTKVIIYLF
jgi:hypothetical protein